ncbi:MAG: hypothetical protein ABR953_10380 [Candidatus Acidiferrales bacterium]
MESHASQPCRRQARQEVAVIHVNPVERAANRGRKQQFGGSVLAALECLHFRGVAEPHQYPPEFPAHVNAPRFMVLRRRELAASVIPPHEDESVGIVGAFAKLDVVPAQR